MKKASLNFIIDVAAFIAFVLLATTGLIMRWILPPGSGGRSGGPALTVWGMSRHEWGSLHFWLAVSLLGVLALHLLRHWRWIVCMIQGKSTAEHSGARLGLGVTAVAGLVFVVLLPFLSGTETRPGVGGGPHGRGVHSSVGDIEGHGPDGPGHDGHALRGRTTVREAAEYLRMTVPEFLRKLDLPPDTPPDENLGPLMRATGRTMWDVRALGGDSGG